MAQALGKWTREDLAQLPHDGHRYEVVHGDLFVTPAPDLSHQKIVAALLEALMPYVDTHDLGRIHQARSIIVFEGSEVEPDLYVRPPMSPPLPTWENAPTPCLVVEVLSPITKWRDRGAKRHLYLEAGVSEYWIVDAEHRSVLVVRPHSEDDLVTGTLTWSPAGAREPFTLDLPAFFTEVLG